MPRLIEPTVIWKISKSRDGKTFYLRACINWQNVNYEFSPGLSCPKSKWDSSKRKVKGNFKLQGEMRVVEKAMLEVFNEHWPNITNGKNGTFVEKVALKLANGMSNSEYPLVRFMEEFAADHQTAIAKIDLLGQREMELVKGFLDAAYNSSEMKGLVKGYDAKRRSLMDFIPFYLKKLYDEKGKKGRNLHLTWYIHLAALVSRIGDVDYGDLNGVFWDKFRTFVLTEQKFDFEFSQGRELFEYSGNKNRLSQMSGNLFHYEKENLSIDYMKKGASEILFFFNRARDLTMHGLPTTAPAIPDKSHRKNKVCLYLEEWEKLANCKLDSQRLKNVRYRAFVGAFTGMRISDWDKINKGLVRFTGERMVEVYTKKTGELVAIPLIPIFEKMMDEIDWKLPTLSDQNFNDYFKELCEVAGLDREILWIETKGGDKKETPMPLYKKVSSHACRRSFATNFQLPPINLKLSIVQRILGHKTPKQTLDYCNFEHRLTAAMVSKDFQRQREKFLYAVKSG